MNANAHANVRTLDNAFAEFGEEMTTAIEQLRRTATIDREIAAVALARARDEWMAEIQHVERRVTAASVHLFLEAAKVTVDRTEPLRRGFWGRLRWIMLGE